MNVRTVPISEFKAHLNAHLASGDQVNVTRRGRLVAIVSPPEALRAQAVDRLRSALRGADYAPDQREARRDRVTQRLNR
ncbi:MAG: hypothetical protein LBO20_08400 [Bifidobacteriaceae bacterium]|jgi:antitoxin (DNA-binding transcriptional repressor) of toxin-antitoxin stability system|nr:hypothetical protein [Bifidobacteriaceae bacterium]